MAREDWTFLSSMVQGCAAALVILKTFGILPPLRRWLRNSPSPSTGTESAPAPSRKMIWAVVGLSIGSVVSSGTGWYFVLHPALPPQKISSIEVTTNADNYDTFATVRLKGSAGPVCVEKKNEPELQRNVYDCLAYLQLDGSVRVILVFDTPLQFHGVRVVRPDGTLVDSDHYRIRGNLHDKALAEVTIDKPLVDQENELILRVWDKQ